MSLGQQIPSTVLYTTGIQIDTLTKAQLKLIHGKIDFFSFDPYSAQYVTAPPEGVEAYTADPTNPLWPTCVVTSNINASGWQISDASFVLYSFIAPQYVQAQMNYIWNTFRPAGVLVAKYRFPKFGENLEPLDAQRYDLERSIYYRAFLTEVLRAVNEDGVNVMGALS